MKKYILMLFLLSLFLPVFGYAECTGGGTSCTTADNVTYTCTDASYGCINDVLALATDGDTINITATGTVTWDSQLAITKKVQIIHVAGPATLTIKSGYAPTDSSCLYYPSGAFLIYYNYTGTSESKFRISGFTFDGDNKANILYMNSSVVNDYTNRIDNNIINNSRCMIGTTSYPKAFKIVKSFGLIDNNTFNADKK